jgi:hypothetical protein
MKMVSVFNRDGDEIRVSPDMVEHYASIGWNQVVVKAKKKTPEIEIEFEESE